MVYRLFSGLCILALFAGAAAAEEIKGKIVSVNVPQESMVIVDEAGKEVPLKVKDGVLTKKGGTIIAIQSLAIDDPVLVITEQDKRKKVWAKEVRLMEEAQASEEEPQPTQEEMVEPEPAPEPMPESEEPKKRWGIF
ncbi:MAG: hypothetical protein PHR44_01700 [Candidatus Omnitrophica bacterium]|nr:hypothetical protein [Candidatus Omnitrophota bacterium]